MQQACYYFGIGPSNEIEGDQSEVSDLGMHLFLHGQLKIEDRAPLPERLEDSGPLDISAPAVNVWQL